MMSCRCKVDNQHVFQELIQQKIGLGLKLLVLRNFKQSQNLPCIWSSPKNEGIAFVWLYNWWGLLRCTDSKLSCPNWAKHHVWNQVLLQSKSQITWAHIHLLDSNLPCIQPFTRHSAFIHFPHIYLISVWEKQLTSSPLLILQLQSHMFQVNFKF